MAHVMLGGDPRGMAPVRTWLLGWGVTVGQWSCAQGIPTLHECDAAILVGPCPHLAENPDALSTRMPAAAPPAPLLLLGELPGSLLLTREAQRVLVQVGPEGSHLKLALESCFNQARQHRNQVHEDMGTENDRGYLEFLGHELRSPLTAAKTALEVLQGDLGGLLASEDSAQDGRLKMLDIALRNIQRLHRTVDWSQDLLELERSLPPGKWHGLSLDEALDMVPDARGNVLPSELVHASLFTDPNLFQVLVGQAVRVLEFALPGAPLQGRWRPAEDDATRVQLWLVPESAAGDCREPRVARTGLNAASDSSQSGLCEELERLARYVISRPLLASLQIQVSVRPDASERPALVLEMPLDQPLTSSHSGEPSLSCAV